MEIILLINIYAESITVISFACDKPPSVIRFSDIVTLCDSTNLTMLYHISITDQTPLLFKSPVTTLTA